jgi:hypothetical protein
MQNFNFQNNNGKNPFISSSNLLEIRCTSSQQPQPMYDPYYQTLKTQEEKILEQWKNCKNDEELARRLQQLEITPQNPNPILSRSFLTTSELLRDDEYYALQLLREEKEEEERKKKKEEKLLKQQQEDEMLAFNLQEQERKKYRSKNYNSYSSSSSHLYQQPSYGSSLNNYDLERAREHAIVIHNQYCSCGKTSTWNNNHLFEMHQRYCQCVDDEDLSLVISNYSGGRKVKVTNQGKKHEHDYRCCSLNHLHTEGCKCVYRDHVHSGNCCQVYHKHTRFCHCSHK